MSDALHPVRMGLEPLPLQDWLKQQPGDDVLLHERARLIAAFPNDVIAALPESAPAVDELKALLSQRGFSLGGARPVLAAIGCAVAEDLCVLTPAANGYRLTAGILCFPNRWKLREKLGGNVLAVHGPVPNYATALSTNVDRFLEKLRPQRAYIRSNWGLASVPDLYLPDPVPPVNPARDADFFVRREDQSFLKLPETGAVVFGIRTTVTPWRDIPDDLRTGILETVAELSPAWLAYKSITREL